MDQHQQIIELSEKLINYSESALRRYEFSKQEGTRGDFHTEVKPFADEVKETAILWKEAATNWVIEHKPKNLYPDPIETAADYIEVTSVLAFFPETSKKRFLDQIQSVEFILESLILAVEKVTQIK